MPSAPRRNALDRFPAPALSGVWPLLAYEGQVVPSDTSRRSTPLAMLHADGHSAAPHAHAHRVAVRQLECLVIRLPAHIVEFDTEEVPVWGKPRDARPGDRFDRVTVRAGVPIDREGTGPREMPERNRRLLHGSTFRKRRCDGRIRRPVGYMLAKKALRA